MLRMIRPSKSILSKNNLKYLGFLNSDEVDIIKSPEENLLNIISYNVHINNLKHINDTKLIYDLLIKIEKFRQFILLNNLEENLILDMLKVGILNSYKKDEIIYKAENFPNFFFLVLVGNVNFSNDSKTIMEPGSFFGNEIFQKTSYKKTALSSSDKTILLLIPKDFIVSNISEKIKVTNEKIKKVLKKSFTILSTIGTSSYNKFFEKLIKIFPKVDDIIISTKDVADAIFLIYNGVCTLTSNENDELMTLEKGDIIGTESLRNLDEKENLMNNRYLYNIINKSNNTIIFKFHINDFDNKIINGLKLQLSSYFSKRESIIKRTEKSNKLKKSRLMENYKMLFKKKENRKEYIFKNILNDFNQKTAEDSFNKIINTFRLKEKSGKDIRKLIPREIFISKKNIEKTNIFKKINRKKFFSLKEYKSKKISKKFTTLINYYNEKKPKNKKIISDFKKLSVFQESKNNEELNNYENTKEKDSISFINRKNSLENSTNNSVFYTAINTQKSINNKIKIFGRKDESYLFSNRLLRKKNSFADNYMNKIKSLLSSSNKNTSSFGSGSRLMSARQQIDLYGCTILDTMNYFNLGEKEKSFNSNRNKKKDNKKCIYYETLKYNLPLLAFCNKKNINF